MATAAVVLSAALAVVSVLLALPRRSRSVPAPRSTLETAAPPRGTPRPVGLLRVVATTSGVAAALLLVPGVPGLAVASVTGIVVWLRSRHWESSGERRRRATLEAELPHVVDLLTAALEAGAAPTTVLPQVAGVVDPAMGAELRRYTTRLALGTDPVTVWASMAVHPQLGRLGVTLHRSAHSGAPVAAALGRLGEDLRARQRAAVEERVRQVEVRAAVPLGVCLLPAFVLVGVVPLVAGSVAGLVATR